MPRARILGSGLNMGGVQPAGGGVTYLLRDEFTTDAAAPLTSPRNAEPGPGTLTIVQNDGQFSISGGALQIPAQTTPVAGDQGFYGEKAGGGSFSRVAGRAVLSKINMSTYSNFVFGWNRNTTLNFTGGTNQANTFYWFNTTTSVLENAGAGPNLPAVLATSTAYQLAIVLRSAGAYYFIKGGAFADWTLLWIGLDDNTATLYPIMSNYASVGSEDYIRVTDLPAPFNTDYGIATINVTSATQSLGAELLTNGDFSAWTGDNPDGWSVTGEVGSDPMVTQVAPNGSAGTGAARFYSSASVSNPRIVRVLLTIGEVYQTDVTVSAYTAGFLRIGDDSVGSGSGDISSAIRRISFFRAATVNARLTALGSAPIDFVIDSASYKRIALNAAQTVETSSILDHTFTIPASPVAGSQTHLLVRINASGEELLNCWDAYLVRNDANSAWDFKYDSYASGTRTNRTTVAGVGNVDTIRVITNLNAHDTYTKVGSTWAKRGSTITSALYNTATLCNTVYTSDFTFGSLVAWPVTHANYNALNNA